MVVGALAEVLEHVLARGKRRLADPVGALAAHMGIGLGRAVHPFRHEVTADARARDRALGHLGRGVVRTARAEIGRARRQFRRVVGAARLLHAGQPGGDPVGAAPLLGQDAAELQRDIRGVERIVLLEQDVALPVLVAIDAPPAPVVEDRLLDLHLDQLALFLDDDDQLQPLGPVLEALHVERPCLAHLVGGDAEAFRLRRVDAERIERPEKVEPVLARRDESRSWRRVCHASACRCRWRPRRPPPRSACSAGSRLLRDPVVAQPDVETALGHLELRIGDLHPVGAAIDDRRGLHRVLHQLQAHPDPGEPAEREP
jgi:hypothetical protein